MPSMSARRFSSSASGPKLTRRTPRARGPCAAWARCRRPRRRGGRRPRADVRHGAELGSGMSPRGPSVRAIFETSGIAAGREEADPVAQHPARADRGDELSPPTSPAGAPAARAAAGRVPSAHEHADPARRPPPCGSPTPCAAPAGLRGSRLGSAAPRPSAAHALPRREAARERARARVKGARARGPTRGGEPEAGRPESRERADELDRPVDVHGPARHEQPALRAQNAAAPARRSAGAAGAAAEAKQRSVGTKRRRSAGRRYRINLVELLTRDAPCPRTTWHVRAPRPRRRDGRCSAFLVAPVLAWLRHAPRDACARRRSGSRTFQHSRSRRSRANAPRSTPRPMRASSRRRRSFSGQSWGSRFWSTSR